MDIQYRMLQNATEKCAKSSQSWQQQSPLPGRRDEREPPWHAREPREKSVPWHGDLSGAALPSPPPKLPLGYDKGRLQDVSQEGLHRVACRRGGQNATDATVLHRLNPASSPAPSGFDTAPRRTGLRPSPWLSQANLPSKTLNAVFHNVKPHYARSIVRSCLSDSRAYAIGLGSHRRRGSPGNRQRQPNARKILMSNE